MSDSASLSRSLSLTSTATGSSCPISTAVNPSKNDRICAWPSSMYASSRVRSSTIVITSASRLNSPWISPPSNDVYLHHSYRWYVLTLPPPSPEIGPPACCSQLHPSYTPCSSRQHSARRSSRRPPSNRTGAAPCIA